MGVLIRGVKNAFRSGVRSVAVILILAISMGLGLSMLLANQAVKDRLKAVRSEVGTTILVNPAGARDFQGGGEPLTTDDIAKITGMAHVNNIDESLNIVATTTGASGSGAFRAFGGGQKSGETNLQSSIDPGTLGRRFQQRSGDNGGPSIQINGNAPSGDFKLPIRVAGVTGSKGQDGQTIKLSEGRQLTSSDKDVAVVGKQLADKNSLKLNSTFTLYNETFTVVGIFDNGTEFGNDSLYIPLATAQRISEAGKEISNAVVTVDSVENLNATVSAISSKLGTDKADVSSTQDNAMTAVSSLQTVERVSLIGFIVSLAAAAVIILLTMLMIVRERRREIGVLKAIGGGNRTIVTQFVTEALALVIIGAIVGFGFATVSGNGIAGALVKSNTNSSSTAADGPTSVGGPGGGRFRAIRLGGGRNQQSTEAIVGNVATTVNASTLAVGLGAAVVIAIVGSAVPAYLISKVRPAEVLRSE